MNIRGRCAEIISDPSVWIPANFLSLGGLIGVAAAVQERNAAAVAEFSVATLACLEVGISGELRYIQNRGKE